MFIRLYSLGLRVLGSRKEKIAVWLRRQLSVRIENAFSCIRTKTEQIPRVGVILGSGLGDFVDSIENKSLKNGIVEFHT